MPTRQHLLQVALHLKAELGSHMFHTVKRMDITDKLREVSNEEGTRLKGGLAGDLSELLADQGVRCFPRLSDTANGDETIRLYHSGSVLTNLIELIQYPSEEGDRQLGHLVAKIKGNWEWSKPTGPAALIEVEGAE